MSKIAVFYGLFCLPGAVVPWYFNLRHSVAEGALPTPCELIAGGFVTPLASSLSSDFPIGTTVLVWMIEARRLKMRNAPLYLILNFLVAFAFVCTLFLMLHEMKLQALKQT